MANIKINGVTYKDVPRVDIPTNTESTASFYEVSGSQEITENGDYDVTTKESVTVNVEGSGGVDDLADLWLPEEETNNYFLLDTDALLDEPTISVSTGSRLYVMGHLENKVFVEDTERYTGTSFDLTPFKNTGRRVLKTFGWAEQCVLTFKNSSLITNYLQYQRVVLSITNGGAPVIQSIPVSCERYVYCGDYSKATKWFDSNHFKSNTELKYLDISKATLTISHTNPANLFLQSTSRLTTQNFKTQEIFDWTGATTTESMFNGLSQLRKIECKLTNCNSVKKVSRMFYSCYELETYGDTEGTIDLTDTGLGENITAMDSMFSACRATKHIKLPVDKLTNLNSLNATFSACWSLQESPELPKNLTMISTGLAYMFNQCYSIKKIDLGGVISTTNYGNMSNAFNYCVSCKDLILDDCDLSNLQSMSNTFQYMFLLENVSLNNATLPPVSMSFKQSTLLTHGSLLQIINSLADASDKTTAPTLTLSTESKALLTDDDIAIATAKNWTIA